MGPRIIIRNAAVALVTLPDGKVSAWGTRRVYERKWTAYVVEPKDRAFGTFFRHAGLDWQVVVTVSFDSKRCLNQWVKAEGATDVEANTWQTMP